MTGERVGNKAREKARVRDKAKERVGDKTRERARNKAGGRLRDEAREVVEGAGMKAGRVDRGTPVPNWFPL